MVNRQILLILALFVVSTSLYGKVLRVASYNISNYLVTDRWYDGRYMKEYPKPEDEKEALRRVIGLVKPDILAVQEMGDEEYIRELQEDLKKEGVDYPYVYVLKGPDPVRHVAMLSKEKFLETRGHEDLPMVYLGGFRTQVRRGMLEVEFETEGVRWSLFSVHLKSRRSSNAQDYESHKQRLSEAVACRERIKERGVENYVIVGDFNDGPRSKTLKRFLKSGKRVLSVPLKAKDSRGEVWTHFRRSYGVYSQIDHFLVSPSIEGKVNGATIVDAPYGLKASDHRMVYADIEF